MAEVSVSDRTLHVRFTTREKLAGLFRDVAVPLTAVVEVGVVEDGGQAVRGIRAPGFDLPGWWKLGTWRDRGRTTRVAVRRGHPALSVALSGVRPDALLLDVDDPEAAAAAVRDGLAER